MTNSYSTPLNYGQTLPMTYNNDTTNIPQKPSAVPYGIAGCVTGGVAGAIVGNKANPYLAKNGEANDTFAKKVFETYIDKAEESVKKAHNQKMEIYKEIDGVKNADDLRALFASKPDAKLKLEPDFLNNVDANNLTESKKTIKEAIEADTKVSYQNLKNKIKTFWDAAQKKFVKPSGADDKVFDAITTAKKGIKGKLIAKYAGVGAVITGTIAVLLQKLLSKNNTGV